MTLRPLTIDDAEAFFYASWDSAVALTLPGFYCDSLEKAKNVISKLLSDPDVTTYVIGSYGIDFAGIIVIARKGEKEIEISSFIDEKYRRKGLATQSLEETLSMYIGYRVNFQIEPYNKASLKIVSKFNAVKDDTYYYHIDN